MPSLLRLLLTSAPPRAGLFRQLFHATPKLSVNVIRPSTGEEGRGGDGIARACEASLARLAALANSGCRVSSYQGNVQGHLGTIRDGIACADFL